MSILSLHKRGMVALLFLGLAFLAFTGLLLTDKIVPKENYVGKTAFDLYRGGELFHAFLFYSDLAVTWTIDDVLIWHSQYGDGNTICTIDDTRVWFSDSCPFSSETLASSVGTVFTTLFPGQLRDMFASLNYSVQLPKHFTFDSEKMLLRSVETLSYRAFNFTYVIPLTIEIGTPIVKHYLITYASLLSHVALRGDCLREHNSDFKYSSCFDNQWSVTLEQDHLFFTISVQDSSLFADHISFAIPLNSIDGLSGEEELFR